MASGSASPGPAPAGPLSPAILHSSGHQSSRRESPARKRIAGLDTARALAIALAITSHSFIHFGVWPLLDGDAGLLVRIMTRSATPTFIILFGMMLEIVYLKLIRRDERPGCWQRLLTRAIQCYLLYLCVVLAGVAGGKLAPVEGLKAALFLSQAYFANILKFYSLGLLGGIVLVELRARFGLGAAVVAAAAIWAAYPLIKALPPMPHGIAHLASFLIGAGAETGPAVLQGMSLVALGMVLGWAVGALGGDDPTGRRRAALLLAGLAALAAAGTALLFANDGLRGALERFTDYGYRGANHPGYYILGSTLAMAVIGACLAVAERLPERLLSLVNVFGISSLFAYAFGNVMLNLLPPLRSGLATGIAATACFLAALYLATAYFQYIQRAEHDRRTLAARLARLHDSPRLLTARLAGFFVKRILAMRPSGS